MIESLKMNSELCSFVLNEISNNDTSYGSNCGSLMLAGEQQPSNNLNDDDIYTAVILEEAEKLYNQLITKLTNSVIAAAAAIMTASFSLSRLDNNNRQKLPRNNDTYQTEQPRYNNNQPEIYKR